MKSVARPDPRYAAHLGLVGLPTAGSWLLAPPVEEDGRAIESSLFIIAVRRRLRLPVQGTDSICPYCGEVMDIYGDHALHCMCHGDSTVRRNQVRDAFADAAAAQMHPEREKAGLLPPAPRTGGWFEQQEWASPGRCLSAKGCIAWIGGLGLHSTEAACRRQGFSFVPMVFESHSGAWSTLARRQVDHVNRQLVPIASDTSASYTAQRLSCALHRANARAVGSIRPMVNRWSWRWSPRRAPCGRLVWALV
eukprot:5508846-Amphidinium_carterae.1